MFRPTWRPSSGLQVLAIGAVWLDVEVSSSKVYRTLHKHVVCSEVLAGAIIGVPGVIGTPVCVCVCVWAWMLSDTLWGSLPLCSVGAPSWFLGSNILVCTAISGGERQEICKGISGCDLLPKSGVVLVALTRGWWCTQRGCLNSRLV
jgi:hypothetical protein